MEFEEDKHGARAPEGEGLSGDTPREHVQEEASQAAQESSTNPEDPYYYDGYEDYSSTQVSEPEQAQAPAAAPAASGGGSPPPSSTSTASDEKEEEDEEGMLRMSFMEHLEELRGRIFRALLGIGIAFLLSLVFANDLWKIVSEPAIDALTKLGFKEPKLAQITPMETFTTVWVKLPMLTAIFLASPWILYQVWAFVAPGLYKRERRWAAPFVICSAGLFILGGLFAYFVAFRFGLAFLLGIGRDINILPMVSVTEYFDLFVNVTLGVGLVFELPILLFFLTLLRIVTPRFLLVNARYAILIIVILAAIVTPTPDIVNLMLFSVPMGLLYFVGIFAGHLLQLHRENRRFPWWVVFLVLGVILALIAGGVYLAVSRYGYKLVPSWPFLAR